MSRQLYMLYERDILPGLAMPNSNRGTFYSVPRYLENFALMRWPDGRPCHLANQFLIEYAAGTNARESPRTYASQLTHLIRFCYLKRIEFNSFNEKFFEGFRDQLLGEEDESSQGNKKTRDRNQVGRIQRRALIFLEWIYDRHPLACVHRIVGVKGTGAAIIVKYKVDPVTKKSYLYHPSLVASEPFQNDKAPITEIMIQSIRDEIFKKADFENLPPESKLKLKSDPELYLATNKYLFERRMCLVRLFKLTGARTEELYDLPLGENSEILTTKELVLPTKKRRRKVNPRRFKIDLSDARLLKKYIRARSDYQDFLASRGVSYSNPAQFFLGADGHDLKKSSLTKEFDRLCEGAGIVARSCLSMFRHRFITREIHSRLLIRFATNPSLRNGASTELRDDVCREVLPLTGHAQASSLWNYFHEQYDFLTSSSPYSEKLQARAKLESLGETLTDVRYEALFRPEMDLSSAITLIEKEIDLLMRTIFDDDQGASDNPQRYD